MDGFADGPSFSPDLGQHNWRGQKSSQLSVCFPCCRKRKRKLGSEKILSAELCQRLKEICKKSFRDEGTRGVIKDLAGVFFIHQKKVFTAVKKLVVCI